MSWFSFHFNDFAFSFLSILLEGVPFILLGSLISGFVDVFVSSERMARLLPRSNVAAIFLAGLMGLIFPMCECGSVIVIRRFIKKGLPVSAAITYMLGAPIVSPIVALSTFMAFKGQNPVLMTSLRLALGYGIAVVVGLIVARIGTARVLRPGMVGDELAQNRTGLRTAAIPSADDFTATIESSGFGKKVLLAFQSATADFLDVTFFLIIGAALASTFNTAVNQAIIMPFATNLPLAILVLMALAAGLALCSTTDAFIAASFATFPPEAKLAFLVFGPMFDVKLFWLYGLIFRRRAVITLALGLFITIFLICWRIGAIGIWQ